MKNNKGFVGIAIAIIAALGLVGFGAYKVFHKTVPPQEEKGALIENFPEGYTSADHTPPTQVLTSDSKIYRSENGVGIYINDEDKQREINALPQYPNQEVKKGSFKLNGLEWKTIELIESPVGGRGMPGSAFYAYGINNGQSYIFECINCNEEIFGSEGKAKRAVFDKVIFSFEFSTPSSVDTSNWKVYKNTKYGFEFKYPSYIGEPVSFAEQEGKLDCNSKGYSQVTMIIFDNLGLQLACKAVIDGYPDKGQKKEITIGGQQGYLFNYTSAASYNNREAFIPLSNGHYLLISDSYKGPARPTGFSIRDFETILSTFKFTK